MKTDLAEVKTVEYDPDANSYKDQTNNEFFGIALHCY